uniref:transposase n=1 Tax=Actinacidiphila bryophytorum TaxID=1436133 RepID=UPI00355629AA
MAPGCRRPGEEAPLAASDSLKGRPDAIGTARPQAVTQTCIVHLLRASSRCAGRTVGRTDPHVGLVRPCQSRQTTRASSSASASR